MKRIHPIILVLLALLPIEINFASLAVNPAMLALSVRYYGPLTGNPRQIAILNNGEQSLTNLSVNAFGLPKGTALSASTCSESLSPGASCTITISPGSMASTDLNGKSCTHGAVPAPAKVIVAADGVTPIEVPVVVLGYGCIYQGGYVYAIDDAYVHYPISGSVGGKIAALVDQAQPYPYGIVWSADKQGGYDNGVSIWGIAETSTEKLPVPNQDSIQPASQVLGQANCNGMTDGFCNSNNVIAYYSPKSSSGVNFLNYAAGLCKSLKVGEFGDWYLPAVCEMGSRENCPKGAANMSHQLAFLTSDSCTGERCLRGHYWSSTEFSYFTKGYAWSQLFASHGDSIPGYAVKGDQLGVRCSRQLTA